MNDSEDDFAQYGVTPALFKEWRSPRLGDHNPTPMNNPVWEWLIRTNHTAYTATQMFADLSPLDTGPGWCFERFGQSCTILPDGKKVYIAGEHEDHYDPDFYIYNDVVVENEDGSIVIFGYPTSCFPPTDFHSATLAGTDIIIIGNLGYPEDREPGSTQVFILDTKSFVIRRMTTSGEMPGWIHDHKAVLSEDSESILVTEGKIDRGSSHGLTENIHDWCLNLNTGSWECVKVRNWSRWLLSRPDKRRNHLWEMRQALWHLEVGWEADYKKELLQLTNELGKEPDVKSVEQLYRPAISHDVVAEKEDEYGIYRIRVTDVTVRYVEEDDGVYITVEGDLPELTIRQLVEDLRRKLSTLENTEFSAEKIT